jgi:hypothetical protein
LGKKVIIALEDVDRFLEFRRKVNTPLLSSLILTKDGKPIHIEKENVDEFMMIGLSNLDFITGKYYLKGKLKE